MGCESAHKWGDAPVYNCLKIMATKPAIPIPLQYRRVDMTFRRPWWVLAGAAIASLWASVGCAVAVFAAFAAMRSSSEPLARGIAVGVCVLTVVLCLMLLVLEWQAVFRYSLPASDAVAILLVLPTMFAALTVGVALSDLRIVQAARSPAFSIVATLVTSLGLACFAHVRWATLLHREGTRAALHHGSRANAGELHSALKVPSHGKWRRVLHEERREAR